MQVKYKKEETISVEEFRQVLVASTLGERRPVNDMARLEKMLANANLIITARLDGKLIGIARSITDFVYCTYLSDLAVDEKYQKMGIGKELIRLTNAAAPEAMLILLSAPAAVEYYPKVGMTKFTDCFIIKRVQ